MCGSRPRILSPSTLSASWRGGWSLRIARIRGSNFPIRPRCPSLCDEGSRVDPMESKIMSKHAAAYLRRSTDRQDQSIGDQRKAIERYAQENGFTIVREYVDDAISGADTESRKQFLKLIEEGQKRDRGFSHVLVYDVS